VMPFDNSSCSWLLDFFHLRSTLTHLFSLSSPVTCTELGLGPSVCGSLPFPRCSSSTVVLFPAVVFRDLICGCGLLLFWNEKPFFGASVAGADPYRGLVWL
jgi:hypothetical protein